MIALALTLLTIGFSPISAPPSFVPLPPGPVVIERGGCPHGDVLLTCTKWESPPRILFPDPAAVRRSLLHELGHAYDQQVLAPSGLRPDFATIDGRPWVTPASEERFAQAYALCARNRRLTHVVTSNYYGFRATPSQHQRTCALIHRASEQIGVTWR